MTDEPLVDSEFSTAEQCALDAWEVPPQPLGLAARALSRAHARRQRRRAVALFAAAACVLVGLAGMVAHFALGHRDEHGGTERLGERRTLGIGRRAIVVAEAGTQLRWKVSASGAAQVTQKSGNVFYRVEPGGPFVVKTAHGTVTVLGTCFRVEVKAMKSKKAGLIGAVSGALFATAVVVSVYEGKVFSASRGTKGGVEVTAGKVVRIERLKPPVLADLNDRSAGVGRSRHAAGGVAAPASARDPIVLSGTAATQHRLLVARAKQLEQEVGQLRSQLQKANDKASKGKILDLSKEEKVALAKRCELRWDISTDGTDAPTLSPQTKAKIGLSDQEAELVNEVLASEHKVLLGELRKLYVEVAGNADAAQQLSPAALIFDIQDKSTRADVRAAFQRIARERAGLQAPPKDFTGLSTVERMMRLLTAAGDKLERAIGQKIGPDLARRHRELDGGYGSKSRSSHGCPK